VVRIVLVVLAVWVVLKTVVFLVPHWRRRLLFPWLESVALLRLSGVLCVVLGAELWWLGETTAGARQVTLMALAAWCLIGGLAFLVFPYSRMTAPREWVERITEQERRSVSVGVAALSCALAAWLVWVSFAP
jgi:hypothetical protein